MEPEAPLAPVEPRRPGLGRALIATTVTLLFLGLSVGYHDGTFWTDSLSDVSEAGPYRFKGVVAHYDVIAGELTFQQGGLERAMRWNITQPEVGRVYVVDAELLENGTLDALALTPVFLFR